MAAARRNFWLAWVAATVVGGLAALAFDLWVVLPAMARFLGTVPASNLRDGLQLAEQALRLIAGVALVAAAQAFVLQRVIGRGVAWVTAAVVGGLLSWLVRTWLGGHLYGGVGRHLPPPSTFRLYALVLVCTASLLIASCLWVACLRRWDRNGLFIVASVAATAVFAWFIAPVLVFSGRMTSQQVLSLQVEHSVAGSLVMGAFTGLVLAMTLVRPAAPSRRRPSKRAPRRKPSRAHTR